MANIESAREHIEKQIENIDSPVGQVGAICLAWLEYAPETAAPLLMAEGKTLGGALEAMREYANKNRGAKNSILIGPLQAMEQILKYYAHEDPIGVVEGGFAYFCMQQEAAKFRPANTQPAADLPPVAPPAPASAPAAKPKKAVTLNLEDLGL
ncbi:MAG: hypothetical protein E7200_04585 [Selenomonas ruminantium]|nr:hypothetical protein [Selenomonas ruminantium]